MGFDIMTYADNAYQRAYHEEMERALNDGLHQFQQAILADGRKFDLVSATREEDTMSYASQPQAATGGSCGSQTSTKTPGAQLAEVLGYRVEDNQLRMNVQHNPVISYEDQVVPVDINEFNRMRAQIRQLQQQFAAVTDHLGIEIEQQSGYKVTGPSTDKSVVGDDVFEGFVINVIG